MLVKLEELKETLAKGAGENGGKAGGAEENARRRT
jgi:hypothetical protein